MKFYVIGLGSIGRRHATNLLALGHEVYGYDTRNMAPVYGVQMLGLPNTPDVDAFVIATPTKCHIDDMERAFSQKKPVFVEKPIIHDSQIVEAADHILEQTTLIAVGNNLRFHPSVQALKRDLVKNKFGSPHWAFVSCGQYNDRAQYLRDGVTLNWGAHEIDLALHLFGPARIEGASIDKDDTVADILLVHDEWYGTPSVVHLDYLTKPEMRWTVLQAGKGNGAAIDLTERTYIGSIEDKPFHFVGAGSYDLDYVNEMQAFVDAVEGKKPWPGATASEALEVLKIVSAAKFKCEIAEKSKYR